MKKYDYCGRQNEDAFGQCHECGTELPPEAGETSTQVNPVTAQATSGMACLHCGELGQLEPVVSPRRRFSWSVFFFGGILSVLFLNNSRATRYHCKKCEASFYKRTPVAKFMLGLLIFWLAFGWLPFLIWIAYTLLS
jgi:DNA-directed RNA polymerase subunit RPC12/RpoP